MQDREPKRDDEAECPRCNLELTKGKSPFYLDNVKIGAFDSLKCEFCGYFFLTKKGLKESSKKMKSMGLTKLEEDYSALVNAEMKISKTSLSELLSSSMTTKKIKKTDITNDEQIILQETTTTPTSNPNYRFLKR